MYMPIQSIEAYIHAKNGPSALFFYSNQGCGVCQVLKPKLLEMVQKQMPRLQLFSIDIQAYPDIAAQNSVFTIPTLDVYLQGQHFCRYARHLALSKILQDLERPYALLP